jgi:hypothetical protein
MQFVSTFSVRAFGCQKKKRPAGLQKPGRPRIEEKA